MTDAERADRAGTRFCEVHQTAEVGETCPCCEAVKADDERQQAQAEAAAAVEALEGLRGRFHPLLAYDANRYVEEALEKVKHSTAAKALLDELQELRDALAAQKEEFHRDTRRLVAQERDIERLLGAAEGAKQYLGKQQLPIVTRADGTLCYDPNQDQGQKVYAALCAALDAAKGK